MTVYLTAPLDVDPATSAFGVLARHVQGMKILPGWIDADYLKREIGTLAYDLGVSCDVIVEIP